MSVQYSIQFIHDTKWSFVSLLKKFPCAFPDVPKNSKNAQARENLDFDL